MKRLEIENITVSYKDKKSKTTVLEDFSFSVSDGELVVILGASGCGKTTLLKAITGVLPIESGKMTISGMDAERLSIKNRNISYVSQSFFTYGFMTIYNNIALPLKAQRISIDEIDKRVKDISKKLGIEYLLSRKPKVLSGGQQQRVAIARALIKNPDLYLFDEPFSNLDPTIRIELRKEVKKIKEEYNASMIFVTHDINDAIYLADRVVVMKDGRIVAEGSVKDLMEYPEGSYVHDFIHRKEGVYDE